MMFQVASTAHRLLSLLAEGLGSGFQPYCRSVLGAMLVKLKDKKCVGVLGTCLDKVYGNPHSLDQVRGCFPSPSTLLLCGSRFMWSSVADHSINNERCGASAEYSVWCDV